MYTLYCGNKNYSSWSLRAWLLLAHYGIPFEERMVSVSGRGVSEEHRAYSGNGLVPCLHDGDFQIWETLAIAEYLAERHPGIWPGDPLARARARSISAEMHAGFGALRGAMPMNVKLRLKGRPVAPEVQTDIDRVVAIWSEARQQFGQGGQWLFGGFSAADAMYAPIVWRFATYNVQLPAIAQAYCDAMLELPAMKLWEMGALAEKACIAECDALVAEYGGAR